MYQDSSIFSSFATVWSDVLSSVMRCANRFSAVLTQKCTIFFLVDDVNNSFPRGHFIQKGGPKQYSGRRNEEQPVKVCGGLGPYATCCRVLSFPLLSWDIWLEGATYGLLMAEASHTYGGSLPRRRWSTLHYASSQADIVARSEAKGA